MGSRLIKSILCLRWWAKDEKMREIGEDWGIGREKGKGDGMNRLI